MSEWVLDHRKRHHRYFEEMTRIPHGSFHEAQYGDYLVRFAIEHHFEYRRDAIGNVIIYKPASAGNGSRPCLALQAHMDMVWAKEETSDHDFLTSPLELYIEQGFLKARGTTLGADDGTGVAYILAVLDDDSLNTPPIEAIFTVQEETGLGGALALKKEEIRSKRLISLDCGGGDSIYISSLGGLHGQTRRKIQWEEACGRGYCLKVRGLKGGYSDGYKREQANANKTAARLVYELSRELPLCLADVKGGQAQNKISTCCEISFTSHADPDQIVRRVEYLSETIKKEIAEAEKGVIIELSDAETTRQMSNRCSSDVLSFLFLFPCGLRHRGVRFPDIMTESINWPMVECQGEELCLTYHLRGALDSIIEHMQEEITLLSGCFGFACSRISSFPAWEFHDSELLHSLQQVFRRRKGKELGLIPVQGGLECGVFSRMDPEMDIIAMGPYGFDVHTPDERLDLQSFDELYEVFCDLLESL